MGRRCGEVERPRARECRALTPCVDTASDPVFSGSLHTAQSPITSVGPSSPPPGPVSFTSMLFWRPLLCGSGGKRQGPGHMFLLDLIPLILILSGLTFVSYPGI